ncbi:MAG: hypothetical protein M0Z55_13255 [Peptococcaceae bacterium]|nr:hypothetical protein [Peptococcaceae bacterium]
MELQQRLTRCLAQLNLPEDERAYLAANLLTIIDARVQALQQTIAKAQENSMNFAKQYSMEFCQVQQPLLAKSVPQTDFINWCFWEKVIANRLALVARYERLRRTHIDT